MSIFFTGDEHYDHDNHYGGIINFCRRPYKDLNKMKASLIGRHNKVVSQEDVVYHIGDFLWIRSKENDYRKVSRILNNMNGRHILVLGNHDDLKPFTYVGAGFESVHTALHLPVTVEEVSWDFYLIHDPSAHCVIPEGGYLLHGHIHTLYRHLLDQGKNAINVGVDAWDFTPISLERIIRLIKKHEKTNVEKDTC